MLLWHDLCNRPPPGIAEHVPLLFVAEEALSMNTTMGHTKINEAVTNQAVTGDIMTEYDGDQGQRISNLTMLGY